MEFDPRFQRPQHLTHLSKRARTYQYLGKKDFLPRNPCVKQETEIIFPSNNTMFIPSSLLSLSSSLPLSILFLPNNTFHYFQDHVMNVHYHHHHVTLAPNNVVVDKMDALCDQSHKGKLAMLDFSQNSTVVHSSSEAALIKSSSSPLPLFDENIGLVMSEPQQRCTDQRIQQKMKVAMDTSIIKGQWNSQEDRVVVELVKQHGLKKWSEIAKSLPGRIGKQCRERWLNHLQPNIKKAPWTLEEDETLIQAHKEFGNKWTMIATKLPHRAENTIKNHWNTSKRRQNCKGNKKKNTRPNYSPYEGSSVLLSYIKKVTAAEESKKKNKNKKVQRCTCDDELALLLSYGHYCSHA